MNTRVPISYWSKIIKELAGNKCVVCGKTDRLQAHHIIPTSIDKSLENELDNGVCLCFHCHYCAHGGSYHTSPAHKRVITTTGWKQYNAVQDYFDTTISLVVPSEIKLSEKIELAARKTGKTFDQYFINAINEALEKDGISINGLDHLHAKP